MDCPNYKKETTIGLAIIIICIMMFAGGFAAKYSEPDIHQATYKELVEITGIGEHKANLILSYLESNKEAEISDLDDIKGIGSILVERIEKVYSRV